MLPIVKETLIWNKCSISRLDIEAAGRYRWQELSASPGANHLAAVLLDLSVTPRFFFLVCFFFGGRWGPVCTNELKLDGATGRKRSSEPRSLWFNAKITQSRGNFHLLPIQSGFAPSGAPNEFMMTHYLLLLRPPMLLRWEEELV